MSLTPASQTLGFGITLLDTGFQRPGMAACYILEEENELAIIETGTKDTVPLLLNYFKNHHHNLDQVRYVIVTHVHLDHAGGAGKLMALLPNAKLVVHEKGARHMVDPAKLQTGATAVYGEVEFKKTYGDLIPIPEAKIIAPENESSLYVGNRKLTFIDTPGHARHHFCIYDETSKGFFTGDTFGLAYKELTINNEPFIFPTTTPVQFDPEALKQSIHRLMSFHPQRMYLTHYGMVESPELLAESLIQQIDDFVDIAMSTNLSKGEDRVNHINEEILNYLLNNLAEKKCALDIDTQKEILKTDALLNAQGLDFWLG